MDLGEFYPCLNVRDLEASIQFYETIGFRLIEDGRAENWAVLQHNNMAVALYQGHIRENLINFRGGDIREIGEALADKGIEFSMPPTEHDDGSWNAEIRDPDGNAIFFNTFPAERARYLRDGKLIDY